MVIVFIIAIIVLTTCGVCGGSFFSGIKRKGVPPAGRFEAAGAWNAMVAHRLRVSDPKQVDVEAVDRLRQAYKAS